MPFYSIVMPVYNRADLVGETLQSLRAQNETDWEIIVVDDGSTDETLAVLVLCDELVRQVRNLFGTGLPAGSSIGGEDVHR